MAGNTGSKRVMTEAQKAALARGRANRKANIAGRRAARGRQGASSQAARLASLANDPQAVVANGAALADARGESRAASAAASRAHEVSTSSSNSSSGNSKPKLSQSEQDALLFEFAMGDDEAGAESAESGEKGPGWRERVGDFFKASGAKPEPTGNQKEDDARAAAVQWQGLLAIAFLFAGSRLFGYDLRPSESMANEMSAPLARIAMRHIDPLRNASADTIDLVAFMTACLVYYQTIEPALLARRQERLTVNATPAQSAQSAQERFEPERQPGRAHAAGNVVSIPANRASGSRRYAESAGEGRAGGHVADERQQSAIEADGAAILSEALGVEL